MEASVLQMFQDESRLDNNCQHSVTIEDIGTQMIEIRGHDCLPLVRIWDRFEISEVACSRAVATVIFTLRWMLS